jgi:hypothetical protein
VKSAGIGIVCLVVGGVVGWFAGGSLGGTPAKDPAAVSGATTQAAAKLPARGDTYEILGRIWGLKKFAVKYDDKVFRGGEMISEEGAQNLKAWGIQTVISVVPNDQERLLCRKYNFKLVEVPFDKKALKTETLEKAVAAFKNEKPPFYVHCHGGTHRGGLLCLTYRTVVLGWDLEKAKAEYDALGGDPDNKDKLMFGVASAWIKAQKK